jgi:hypothetical protein
MDNGLIFPYPRKSEGVTEKASLTACWNRRTKHRSSIVGKSAMQCKGVKGSERGNPSSEENDASFQEKLLAIILPRPVPKPTQVGKERILR